MNELILVKLVRSPIGTKERVRQTLRGLGLGKVGSSHILKRTPQVEGMLRRVPHLVAATEVPLLEQTSRDRGNIRAIGERRVDNRGGESGDVAAKSTVEAEPIIAAEANRLPKGEAATLSAEPPMAAAENHPDTTTEETQVADQNSDSTSTDETE